MVGAGPVGLLTALKLAHHGVRCMLVERNTETTRWPKMDITNVRSMELLRTLGLADEFRKQGMYVCCVFSYKAGRSLKYPGVYILTTSLPGVPQNYSFDVLFSTGLGKGGEKLATWDLPSPDWWREKIRKTNDGSMPREPYQRCSQVIFEAWLKPICEKNSLISTSFGLKFEDLAESEEGVKCTLTDLQSGKKVLVRSEYVVGCDGAGSRVRRSTGLKITGGPV